MVSDLSIDDLPPTTAWHRRHGRPSRRDRAATQQYISPQEEKAVAEYVLRMARSGHPVPVKSLRSIAQTIRRQRDSTFQLPLADDVPPPGKNWPQGFYRRHPKLRARRLKAIDRNRHEQNIYDKVVEWFAMMEKELKAANILSENVYNMDETGVLLSVLGSLKVVVSSDEVQSARPACVQRTSITAVECISADGRYLPPLIMWPAATHRATWTAHPTPGWHFAVSKSGYTDTAISLYWVQHVFDPLTRSRAKGRPRLLLSDGFGTHESLEVLTFCFQNDIILCRLPSHTLHKLQPCDIGVFGPLKLSYREQVERLYRGGANTIGKQHFALLYSRARELAFTPRNIRSSWAKAGLFPFDPERVLGGMVKPSQCAVEPGTSIVLPSPTCSSSMNTPTTLSSFDQLRSRLDANLATLDDRSRRKLQKLWNAAEKVYADRAVLFDENKLLYEQNNERKVRQTASTAMVGRAKVMRYEDILDAQRRRDERASRRGWQDKMAVFVPPTAQMLAPAEEELLQSRRDVEEAGLVGYCNVSNLKG